MERDDRFSNVLLAATSAFGLALLALPTHSLVVSLKTVAAYCLHPAPRILQKGVEGAVAIPATVAGLLKADQENRIFREEFKSVELLMNRIEAIEGENARLKGLLGLAAPAGFEPIWASLLHRDPAHWYGFVILDKGSSDGLEENAPVLAVRNGRLGVVGRVAETTPGTAKVLLITDDLSSVTVAVGDGWSALVEGEGGPLLRLNYVSERVELKAGSEILTSPISPTFPAGLPVGRIVEVLPPDPYLSFQAARVEPIVQVGRLREVMVLRWTRKGKRPLAAPTVRKRVRIKEALIDRGVEVRRREEESLERRRRRSRGR